MNNIKCARCGVINWASAVICKRCEANLHLSFYREQLPQQPIQPIAAVQQPSVRPWLIPDDASMLCTTCGSAVQPLQIWRGSVGAEVALFLGGIFMLLISFLLSVALIITFVVYAVWRIASKYKGCPVCRN